MNTDDKTNIGAGRGWVTIGSESVQGGGAGVGWVTIGSESVQGVRGYSSPEFKVISPELCISVKIALYRKLWLYLLRFQRMGLY